MRRSDSLARLAAEARGAQTPDNLVARLVEEMSEAATAGRESAPPSSDPALALVEARLEQFRRNATDGRARPAASPIAPAPRAVARSIARPVGEPAEHLRPRARARPRHAPEPLPAAHEAEPVSPPVPADPPVAPFPEARATAERARPDCAEAVIVEAADTMDYPLVYRTVDRHRALCPRPQANPACRWLRPVLFLAVLAAAVLLPFGGIETRAPAIVEAFPTVAAAEDEAGAALPLTQQNLRIVRTVPVGADGRLLGAAPSR